MGGKFQGQVVLVTGAASGIGYVKQVCLVSYRFIYNSRGTRASLIGFEYSRATTLKLAALGASLALCDINTTALSTIASELPNASLLTQKVDVGSESDVKSFVSAILEKFGRLDHVFNCAGINPANIPFAETTLEYWDKQCNTNLKGVFLITRESLPHLKRGSSIVTVSSMSGTRGTALQSVYRYITNICLFRTK